MPRFRPAPVAAFAVVFQQWRKRSRDRAELRILIQQGFDFTDMSVTRALAASEAQKWPWQEWGPGWAR
jgi:hypothetical protein